MKKAIGILLSFIVALTTWNEHCLNCKKEQSARTDQIVVEPAHHQEADSDQEFGLHAYVANRGTNSVFMRSVEVVRTDRWNRQRVAYTIACNDKLEAGEGREYPLPIPYQTCKEMTASGDRMSLRATTHRDETAYSELDRLLPSVYLAYMQVGSETRPNDRSFLPK